MKEQVVGAVVGAIITGLFSVLIFHLGNFSTQKSIVESLSVRFDSVDKGMSYEQALQIIYEETEQLKANNASLQKILDELNVNYSTLQSENKNLQSEIESLKNKDTRIEQITLAESYASTGNYEVAIPILNEITEKSEDVNALLKEYTTNYESSIISNAELLANNGNYDEATALINAALKIIPDSSTLLDKKNLVTPKYLVDTVECYKAKNLWLLDSREYIKMSGKSYKHAIYTQQSDAVASMFNSSYSANAFYNLDGKYTQLSGIVGHVDFSGSGTIGENDGGQVYDAEITIWGDDKEICTIPLSSNDTATGFNESIEGVNILEFRVKCSGNSKVGIAEIQIR